VHLSVDAMRADLSSRVSWGIILGLVVGKWVGVSGGTLLFAKLRLGRLPTGVQTRHVIGVGALAGIGFTVALFIATLAYPAAVGGADPPMLEEAKFGILCGSLVAGAAGAVLLSRRPRRR
jgi:Na+:H+ antiporter, NhaA family